MIFRSPDRPSDSPRMVYWKSDFFLQGDADEQVPFITTDEHPRECCDAEQGSGKKQRLLDSTVNITDRRYFVRVTVDITFSNFWAWKEEVHRMFSNLHRTLGQMYSFAIAWVGHLKK